MRKLTLALAATALVALGLGLARADDEKKDGDKKDDKKEQKVSLKAGDAAPDFKVKDSNGKEVKLADLKDKRFVLWFFPKANTGG